MKNDILLTLLPPEADPNDLTALPDPVAIEALSSEDREVAIRLVKEWIIQTRDHPISRAVAKQWLRSLTNEWQYISGYEAFEIAQAVEAAIAPEFHVALAGSCLNKGFSLNDVDLKVYAHNNSDYISYAFIKAKLIDAGFLFIESLKEDEAYEFTYQRWTTSSGTPLEISFIHHI